MSNPDDGVREVHPFSLFKDGRMPLDSGITDFGPNVERVTPEELADARRAAEAEEVEAAEAAAELDAMAEVFDEPGEPESDDTVVDIAKGKDDSGNADPPAAI